MEKNYQPDQNLTQWVNEFEILSQQGEKASFDKRIYQKLIEYYENDGDVEKALEVTDSAIEQYGYRVDFYLIKAKLLLHLKEPKEAMDCLSQAEHLSPNDQEVLLTKAMVLAELKDPEAALAILNSMKKYVGQTDLIEVLICETEVYFRQEEYDRAFVTLKDALRFDPYHEKGQQLLSEYISSSRHYKSITKFLQEMLESAPYSHFAWYNLGHCYSNLGEYEQAIDAFEYAFLIKPKFEQAYNDCAEICVQLRQWDKAYSIYQELLSTFGEEYDLLVSLAECCLNLQNYPQAKIYLNQSLNLDTFGEESHFLMGECFAREGKWHKAIQSYRRAISIDESSDSYLLSLAKAYAQIGEFQKADKHFRKATSCAPEQNTYWYEHASFLLKHNRLNKALDVLDKAELSSVGSDLLYCRAAVYYLQGFKSKSIDVLAEVLEDDFSTHSCVFDLVPEMQDDRDIQSIINYYKGEIFE